MLKDGSITSQAHNYQLKQDLKQSEQSPYTKMPWLCTNLEALPIIQERRHK